MDSAETAAPDSSGGGHSSADAARPLRERGPNALPEPPRGRSWPILLKLVPAVQHALGRPPSVPHPGEHA